MPIGPVEGCGCALCGFLQSEGGCWTLEPCDLRPELELEPPEVPDDWEELADEQAREVRRVLRRHVAFGFVLGVCAVLGPIVAFGWLLS